ncbi:hypothetical protein NHJ13734_009620 [Beauveria thailandica]
MPAAIGVAYETPRHRRTATWSSQMMIAKTTMAMEPQSPRYCYDELHNVRKAINWAVQVWDADIVNLSLAMRVESRDIDEALSKLGIIAIHCTDGEESHGSS